MPAILITEPIAPAAFETLRQKGYAIQTGYGEPNPAVAPDDIEAILVRNLPIDAQTMARYPNLKIIAYHGVGIDGIDLEAAKARGVAVTRTPGQNALAVAEHTMSLILALSKRLVPVAALHGTEGYDCKYRFTYSEISGKTLGIIGMGDIGSRVAQMAMHGFGMRVIAYTPSMRARVPGVEMVSDPLDVFKRADFVSLHCPATPQTYRSVGETQLMAMKPTAYLINCARGTIVDQDALIRALQEGRIAGAGLDVTDPEPCPTDCPLLHMPNVIVTPHVAASSDEALLRVANMCIESIEDVLAGREPKGRVV